jgi:hypothetical protein
MRSVRPQHITPFMENYPHKREVEFDFKGYNVVLIVFGWKPIDDHFFYSCVAQWQTSNQSRKMTCNMNVYYPTVYGA